MIKPTFINMTPKSILLFIVLSLFLAVSLQYVIVPNISHAQDTEFVDGTHKYEQPSYAPNSDESIADLMKLAESWTDVIVKADSNVQAIGVSPEGFLNVYIISTDLKAESRFLIDNLEVSYNTISLEAPLTPSNVLEFSVCDQNIEVVPLNLCNNDSVYTERLNEQKSAYSLKLSAKNYQPQAVNPNAVNDNNRILFIGDSITVSNGGSRKYQPAAVASSIVGASFSTYAEGGKTSCDYGNSTTVLTQIQDQIRTEGIRYVSIMLGANDSMHGFSPSTYYECMKKIIQAVTDTDVSRVLLNTPLWIGGLEHDGGNSIRLDPYRSMLQRLANEQASKHVYFADTYSYIWFSQHTDMYADPQQVHPNPTGYQYLGQFWANAFKVVEALETTGCPKNNVCSIYRAYNTETGAHHYISDQNELVVLTRAGWNFEGISMSTPVGGIPVYRAYQPISGEHLWTMDKNELNTITHSGWTNEGLAWYASSTVTSHPIYRLFNHRSGEHLYSSDKNEYVVLQKSGDWNNDGIAYYSL
ncbi:hypothetical protein FACS1894125_4590 [Actinomycetota bacterium]|nr:hypothetical protein FACS1894125_4590 [Actinomycetota bacterium]